MSDETRSTDDALPVPDRAHEPMVGRDHLLDACDRLAESATPAPGTAADTFVARCKTLRFLLNNIIGSGGLQPEAPIALLLAAMMDDAQPVLDELTRLRAAPSAAHGTTTDIRGADRLAAAVLVLVESGVIGARSPAGDALLDYAQTRHGDVYELSAAIERAVSAPLAAPATESGEPIDALIAAWDDRYNNAFADVWSTEKRAALATACQDAEIALKTFVAALTERATRAETAITEAIEELETDPDTYRLTVDKLRDYLTSEQER